MEKRNGRILVADDEKEIREILELLLTAEGYEVVQAADGEEALGLADDSLIYIFWT